MKIEKLKEKARRHEQREEWAKAMELYAQALERAGDEDEGDIALHNRMGDLQVRVGDLEGALTSYQTAIDLYLDADLANNALAVCRKLERNAPGHASVLLRMGQIRIRQGFVVDAREDFLNYAERQLATGDSDEALRALEEFAALVPDDVEIRMFLAGHLRNAGRVDHAIEYLSQAYRTLKDRGAEERAQAVHTQAIELDPDADLDRGSPEESEEGEGARPGGAPQEEPLGFEATSLAGMALDEAPDLDAAPSPEQEPEPMPMEEDAPLEGTVLDLDEGGEHVDELAALEDAFEDLPEEPAMEEPGGGLTFEDFALDSLETDPDVQEEGEELPLLEDPPQDAEPSDEPDHLETPAAAMGSQAELSSLTAGAGAGGGADPRGVIEALKSRLETDPGDGRAWRQLGAAFFEQGKAGHGREALERAHRAFGDAGDPEKAMRVLRELIFHDPDRIEYYQRLVEYAHMTADRALLVPAFLELAEALSRTGADRKAQAVYREVLALDPRNPRAREALAPGAAPASRRADFVNLGGMVLDEPAAGSFRWKVADAEPSGDEEADFARMLGQFKEKVAQNVPSDDATAHYDLGAAYRDMGLLDEAVAQFQRAIRAEPSHLAAYEMVGQCFLEKGDPEIAVRTLTRALDLRTPVEEDLLGIYYYLGKAHESVGNSESAREFYERVFSLDINFQDVTERLRALR